MNEIQVVDVLWVTQRTCVGMTLKRRVRPEIEENGYDVYDDHNVLVVSLFEVYDEGQKYLTEEDRRNTLAINENHSDIVSDIESSLDDLL